MDQKKPAWLKPDKDIPQQSHQDDRVLEAILIQSRYVCTMVQHIVLLANVNERYIASQSSMQPMQSRPWSIYGMFLHCPGFSIQLIVRQDCRSVRGVAEGVCGNCRVWDKSVACSFNKSIIEQERIIDKATEELEDLKPGTNEEIEAGEAREREEIVGGHRLRQGVLPKKYCT